MRRPFLSAAAPPGATAVPLVRPVPAFLPTAARFPSGALPGGFTTNPFLSSFFFTARGGTLAPFMPSTAYSLLSPALAALPRVVPLASGLPIKLPTATPTVSPLGTIPLGGGLGAGLIPANPHALHPSLGQIDKKMLVWVGKIDPGIEDTLVRAILEVYLPPFPLFFSCFLFPGFASV